MVGGNRRSEADGSDVVGRLAGGRDASQQLVIPRPFPSRLVETCQHRLERCHAITAVRQRSAERRGDDRLADAGIRSRYEEAAQPGQAASAR